MRCINRETPAELSTSWCEKVFVIEFKGKFFTSLRHRQCCSDSNARICHLRVTTGSIADSSLRFLLQKHALLPPKKSNFFYIYQVLVQHEFFSGIKFAK
jgi:hypothetical protein